MQGLFLFLFGITMLGAMVVIGRWQCERDGECVKNIKNLKQKLSK